VLVVTSLPLELTAADGSDEEKLEYIEVSRVKGPTEALLDCCPTEDIPGLTLVETNALDINGLVTRLDNVESVDVALAEELEDGNELETPGLITTPDNKDLVDAAAPEKLATFELDGS
jgi:hypothetical protein